MPNDYNSLYDVEFRSGDTSADQTSESDGDPMASNPKRNVGDKTETEIISISARTEPTTPDLSAGSEDTGPRTEAGKKISSRNAFKHGIFSEVTVLQGESRKKYASLHDGLREALKPEGKAEEILVEKLAVLSWRLRRLLLAESAGIRTETENIRFGQQNDKLKASHGMSRSAFFGNSAFIEEIHNPNVLEYCLELLVQLREKIDKGAFNQKRDMEILERIYGPENDGDDTLKSVYARSAATAGSSEEERKAGAFPTPEQCKRVFLNEIDREMHQLRLNSKRSKWVEFGQSKLEIHQRMVPDSPGLDRLLRYEASLERSFDRTLGQLERMQRLRRGQPVAPRIDVNIAS